MSDLKTLRSIADAAYIDLRAIISKAFPGCDEWHWYRALEHVAGSNMRRNDDASMDKDLAVHEGIAGAHAEYIRSLHAFYALRDGPKGFLGARGL